MAKTIKLLLIEFIIIVGLTYHCGLVSESAPDSLTIVNIKYHYQCHVLTISR